MLWKVASFALILAVSAQHSLPYSRIVSTHATYAALLASIEIFLFLKTSGFNFANALLADAILASTSASCPGSLSSIEPRYFALSTTGIVQLAMSLIVTLMSLKSAPPCVAAPPTSDHSPSYTAGGRAASIATVFAFLSVGFLI